MTAVLMVVVFSGLALATWVVGALTVRAAFIQYRQEKGSREMLSLSGPGIVGAQDELHKKGRK